MKFSFQALFSCLVFGVVSVFPTHSWSTGKDARLFITEIIEYDRSAMEAPIFINGLNLPENYRQSPPIQKDETWWLYIHGKELKVHCQTVTVEGDGLPGVSSGIKATFSAQEAIPNGYAVLSKTSFPIQTWRSERNGSNAIIHTKDQKSFLIENSTKPAKNVVMEGPAEVTVSIFELTRDGNRTLITSFGTNSPVDPIIDIDGDGVPEVVNVEWYKEIILRRFFPKVETIVIRSSGV